MSIDKLMALVPIEAASSLSSTTSKGRRSRWERVAGEKSKTRFGPKDDIPYHPPPFVDLPPGLTPLQMDQFLREQRLEELNFKLDKGELEFGDPDIRAPSPPPAYDKNGNRINTRDIRVRMAMVSEHQRLIEHVSATVPGFIPPNDFKPVKKIRRIIIPQEKYPEYNFMGLIIGPRGCNHKRLEAESGAQISIRGRGTQKEGKKTDHQTEEEAAMPQHIHIAADTEESLDKAVSLIEPLLNPSHPAHEEFKKKGLEQLALVNGVSLNKLDSRCSLCGATGHLSWECPDADFQSFDRADVLCGLCGDKGHVTMDCKLAKNLSSEQLAEIEKKIQGITNGGPVHFGGGGGAVKPMIMIPQGTSQRAHDNKLDMEFLQMMSELSHNKNSKSKSGSLNLLDNSQIPLNPFVNTNCLTEFMNSPFIPPPPPPTAPMENNNTTGHCYPYAYTASQMNIVDSSINPSILPNIPYKYETTQAINFENYVNGNYGLGSFPNTYNASSSISSPDIVQSGASLSSACNYSLPVDNNSSVNNGTYDLESMLKTMANYSNFFEMAMPYNYLNMVNNPSTTVPILNESVNLSGSSTANASCGNVTVQDNTVINDSLNTKVSEMSFNCLTENKIEMNYPSQHKSDDVVYVPFDSGDSFPSQKYDSLDLPVPPEDLPPPAPDSE